MAEELYKTLLEVKLVKEARKLINTRKPGVEEKDIENTEKLIGARFPYKYRELIKLVNNAEIEEWVLYPIKDSMRIAKTFDDVLRNNKVLDSSKNENRMIYIAEDGTGDLLGYKYNHEGKMEETIYLYNHETLEITPIYNDIEEMINHLLKTD